MGDRRRACPTWRTSCSRRPGTRPATVSHALLHHRAWDTVSRSISPPAPVVRAGIELGQEPGTRHPPRRPRAGCTPRSSRSAAEACTSGGPAPALVGFDALETAPTDPPRPRLGSPRARRLRPPAPPPPRRSLDAQATARTPTRYAPPAPPHPTCSATRTCAMTARPSAGPHGRPRQAPGRESVGSPTATGRVEPASLAGEGDKAVVGAPRALQPGEALPGVAAGREPLQLRPHVARQVPARVVERGRQRGQLRAHQRVQRVVAGVADFERDHHGGASSKRRASANRPFFRRRERRVDGRPSRAGAFAKIPSSTNSPTRVWSGFWVTQWRRALR